MFNVVGKPYKVTLHSVVFPLDGIDQLQALLIVINIWRINAFA